MLTTSRKIEIATAVMKDKRLGDENRMYYNFVPYGICEVLRYYTIEEDYSNFKEDLRKFANKINIATPLGEYWFSMKKNKARTERIEFLTKYIQHLKEQL